LSRHWQHEFEVLCTLLANSMVVHADETSWSIHSVWAFLSEQARVLLFGVHKDGDTLEKILDPATFAGIMISDDAAVYANFSQSQKCWAHLLR
jgi:transposase